MIVALDVHYEDESRRARAAALVFSTWDATSPHGEHSCVQERVEPYEPGSFFKRELPCLLRVLSGVTVAINVVVVDGYVDTTPGHPGLGRHLWEALGKTVPVVGVAKTSFWGTEAIPVLRGESKSPLYVSAAGMPASEAADLVRGMHGPYRIPTMLTLVDQLSRRPLPPLEHGDAPCP